MDFASIKFGFSPPRHFSSAAQSCSEPEPIIEGKPEPFLPRSRCVDLLAAQVLTA